MIIVDFAAKNMEFEQGFGVMGEVINLPCFYKHEWITKESGTIHLLLEIIFLLSSVKVIPGLLFKVATLYPDP